MGVQHGQGEQTSTDSNAPTVSQRTLTPAIIIGPLPTTEQPLSDPGEPAENIDQGVVEPTPTVEQRKFSAPEMEWDATK